MKQQPRGLIQCCEVIARMVDALDSAQSDAIALGDDSYGEYLEALADEGRRVLAHLNALDKALQEMAQDGN